MNTSVNKFFGSLKSSLKRGLMAGFLMLATLGSVQIAWADYVGETQTTKYLDQQTIDLITARFQAGNPGLQVGDEISYIIQFTPYPGTGVESVGGGAYLTDYIPVGTQVVNAQFVNINSDGTFTQVAPPPPAEVKSIFVPQYSETGIFYSTDPRTVVYTNNGSTTIDGTNGYAGPAGGIAPYSIHNAWDKSIFAPYVANPTAVAGCAAPAPAPTVPSPVAGPDAFIQGNVATGQGPWHRISYPGSMIGTAVGVLGSHAGCIGGTPTSAGWLLSSGNPLPANVNAVRFAGGQVTVGQLFAVRITLRITQAMPSSGLINNSEVFGGDVSILSNGSLGSKSTVWKYLYPSVANANTTLTVVKRITGMCTGVGCVPAPYSGASVPASANLKLRYEVSYLNSSGSTQTNVQLTDYSLPVCTAPATYATLVAGSELVKSGPNILPTTPVGASGFNFTPIVSLGSGAGGTVQFDVVCATAPVNNKNLSNAVRLTSSSLPGGVTSSVTATAVTTANLSVNKTSTTPTRTTAAPDNVATYTVNIPNNGLANATSIVVTDYLPKTPAAGTTAADQFTYLTGSVVATSYTAAGVATVLPAPTIITATVPVGATGLDASYVGRQKVTFTFPAVTAIVSMGKITLEFSATVGANIPQQSTPYLNDAAVSYVGGSTTAGVVMTSLAQGVAPVTVVVPMSLTKTIDCVYSGVTCVPYSNGATIPTASKIRYRLSYSNTDSVAQTNVVLTDTLPANTSFVVGTATQDVTGGNTSFAGFVPPTVAAPLITFGTIASMAAGENGSVTFDVQLGAAAALPSGSYITNTAKLVSTNYPGGTTTTLTSSVLDQANLVVTKTTSTPTLVVNGTATYTFTVQNTGAVAAQNIKIYDWLPFVGTVANANSRFNFTVGSTLFVLTPSAIASTLIAPPAPVTSIGAANISPHNTLPNYANQQQILWTFAPAQTLAPGASFTLTYTAAAGAAGGIPAGSTVYTNDAQIIYQSGVVAGNLYGGVANAAPITIPTNLSITKTIDCIYNTAGTICNAYTGSGFIPTNAKVRYKIHYANTAATVQTNVYICDQLPVQTVAIPIASVTVPAIAPTPAGSFTNTPAASGGPPSATLTSPAAAQCGFPVVAGQTTFNYPVIASLAGNTAADVYYDVQLTTAGQVAMANTGKIVSATATAGQTSSVSAVVRDVPNLVINKTTITPALVQGGVATYAITVTNTGTAPTTDWNVYDFLPYEGTTADATKRFSFVVGSSVITGTAAVTPTVSISPTISPYNANANQQQVSWAFPVGQPLAAGESVTITFNATVGSAMTTPATAVNSISTTFNSAAGAGSTSLNGVAPIDLIPRLTVAKSIIAVCSGTGCTPTAYTVGTVIPANAKIRYQIDYANPSTTIAQTNVVLSDILPTQTAAAPVSNVVIVNGLITTPAPAALSGLAAGGATLNFPILASLPASASGTITLDVQTTAPTASTISNAAKIVSTEDVAGITSVANVNTTSLVVNKTIDCVYSGATCTAGSYVIDTLIPANAKIRYKIVYSNESTTTAQTNVVLSDILPTQTAAAPVSNVVIVNGLITAPAPATLSGLAAGGATLNFPALASLPASATGTITLDVQTTAPAATTLSNTAKITSTDDTTGVTSVVSAMTNSLVVTKIATLVCDPVNGTTNAKNIPGAIVRWTITVANSVSATVSASLTTIDDVLDSNTTMDPNLVTGLSAAACTSAVPAPPTNLGVPESAAGRGFKIITNASRPLAGTAGGAAVTSSFFTTASTVDDGVDYNVTTTNAATINFTTAMPAGGAYAAGELKPGETVTVYFNVTVN